LKSEVWKQFRDTDYQVSNLGKVRKNFKTVKQYRRSTGYMDVHIRLDGKTRPMAVHRIVCESFHGKPPTEKHQVNHMDGDKGNNNPDNLEWVTAKENARHSRHVLGKQIGLTASNTKMDEPSVMALISLMLEGQMRDQDLAPFFNMSRERINSFRLCKSWTKFTKDLGLNETDLEWKGYEIKVNYTASQLATIILDMLSGESEEIEYLKSNFNIHNLPRSQAYSILGE